MLEHPKVPLSQSQAYLKLIASHQGSGAKENSTTTGGLLVLLSEKEVRYLEYSNILDLRLTAKQFIDKTKELEKSIMELNLKKEIQLEHVRKRDRSYDRGISR
ncbi:hypothetical protein PSECIP111951_04155 [Pseudoalteromonas holothuriae]|uniref:Uncharacterized protein n=2 Tax=Pseudoalteromonas holothuriae TaxID=2963714 RepID=A0ABM9GNQ0_9GAMM|nr:hypothetical protein PSECIP111951_04155 [Pseudoalteromonas sp. CIP111951]